jgi:hypothetical protein
LEKTASNTQLYRPAPVTSGPAPADEIPVRRFASKSFPGDESFALVFGRSLVQPLAWCILPLMILSVANALYGYGILSFTLFGLPVALVAATTWTVYHLKAELALLWVAGPLATVVSTWDCFRQQPTSEWQAVLDLRVASDACYVTIGDARYELERTLWPDFEEIVDAIRSARQSHSLTSP